MTVKCDTPHDDAPYEIELPLALQQAGFRLANNEEAIRAGAEMLNGDDAPSDPILIALKDIRDRLTRIEKFISLFFEEDNDNA